MGNEGKDKTIKWITSPTEKHWVGNGFNVHTIFHPAPEIREYLSPFILMDYAPPKNFPPGTEKRGVGEHPHRGFETVTLCYSGEIDHRDSGGGGGRIGPGGVQWMTAAKGLVHEEFHSEESTKKGGLFEMVQLWVNLPKKDKMGPHRYQGIRDEDFPRIEINPNSKARLIAGNFMGKKGPCLTHSKMTVFDLDLKYNTDCEFDLEEGTNTLIFVLRGKLKVQDKSLKELNLAVFERSGKKIRLQALDEISNNSSPPINGGQTGVKILILNGFPIEEPIFAYGPFVMNTKEEIIQAIDDYKNGKMGKIR